jgi:hypothetical protein
MKNALAVSPISLNKACGKSHRQTSFVRPSQEVHEMNA